jgi:AraC-like DNA-binding protein
MLLQRPPCRALLPWVSRIWAAHEPARMAGTQWRERMLPSGGFHLVLRLDDSRIRIFDGIEDRRGCMFTAVVGGARSRFHVREATAGAYSMGVQIRPGAAGVVLGVPAEELAERHTSLEDVWGTAARALRERLLDAGRAAHQLELLEGAVLARLMLRFAPHPAVETALASFGSEATGWEVGSVRRGTHLSHRRFVQLFRRQVGLGPKQLCRVLRLGHALEHAKRGTARWAEVAHAAGYYDQSHLVHELKAVAGMTPTAWAALPSESVQHLPVVTFFQDQRARGT